MTALPTYLRQPWRQSRGWWVPGMMTLCSRTPCRRSTPRTPVGCQAQSFGALCTCLACNSHSLEYKVIQRPLYPLGPLGMTNLISGNSYEALDATVDTRRLQQNMRAVGVVDGEGQRVAKRVVHVRLHVLKISQAVLSVFTAQKQKPACAAKCMTVSMPSSLRMKLIRSALCISPLTNCARKTF